MSVKFDLFLLYNGKITGQLGFDQPYTSLFSFLKELREFTLEGVIASSGKRLRLIAGRCVLGSYKDSESKFSSHNVMISAESTNMEIKPSGEFLIEFGLVNVYETFRVIVDTNVGTIFLSHIKCIEELIKCILNRIFQRTTGRDRSPL